MLTERCQPATPSSTLALATHAHDVMSVSRPKQPRGRINAHTDGVCWRWTYLQSGEVRQQPPAATPGRVSASSPRCFLQYLCFLKRFSLTVRLIALSLRSVEMKQQRDSARRSVKRSIIAAIRHTTHPTCAFDARETRTRPTLPGGVARWKDVV